MSRLVVGSTAATVMLLAGALLVGRGAMRIIGSDDAFDPRGIVELTARVADSADAVARSRELLTRVGELSDVAAVAVGPMPRATAPATVEMRPDRSAAQRGMGMIAGVSAEYFATLSMELVAGRAFTPDEVRSGTPVAVVSSATAARLWPNQSPLGKRVRLAGSDSMGGDFTVVGVTPDVVSPSVRESWMEAYIPFGGRASRGTTLVARLTRGGEGRWSELPARIPRISGVEISGVVRLEDALRERASVPRYLLIGFGLVGGVGLVLVAIGLYAIAAFMVHRRTHEIGVRIALGADATSVAALLVRQSASRVVIGLGLGAAAGLGIAPLLASKLAGVARFDPAALLVAIGVVGLVSAIALMVPARRVSRVNALAALRSE